MRDAICEDASVAPTYLPREQRGLSERNRQLPYSNLSQVRTCLSAWRHLR